MSQEGMRLGIKHIVIEINDVRWREQQIEVLERFGKPKTLDKTVSRPVEVKFGHTYLHIIFLRQGWGILGYVSDRCVCSQGRLRSVDNGIEHVPSQFLPYRLASYSVHYEDALYSLWSQDVARILRRGKAKG